MPDMAATFPHSVGRGLDPAVRFFLCPQHSWLRKRPPGGLQAAPTSNGKSGGSAGTPRLPERSCGGVKTPPYKPTEDPNAPQNHNHRTGQRAPRKIRTPHKTAIIGQSGEIHNNSEPKSQTTNCIFLIIWEPLGPAGQTCKGFTCGLVAEGLYW